MEEVESAIVSHPAYDNLIGPSRQETIRGGLPLPANGCDSGITWWSSIQIRTKANSVKLLRYTKIKLTWAIQVRAINYNNPQLLNGLILLF